MREVVLVTGASGGIGADLARVFARHGHDLALVARTADRLDALADELKQPGRLRPIVLAVDLATHGAAAHVANLLDAAEARVVCLVNNAGYGLAGAVASLDPSAQLGIVDLNIRSLLDLTLRFLPQLRASHGKILNVGSIASFMPGPGMAVYYASKAFVSAFSRALSEELKQTGVGVSVLHPGVTATGFHHRAGLGTAGTSTRGASPLSVAEIGYEGLMSGRRVIVPGVGNKLGSLIMPILPDWILLPLIHRFQNRRQEKGPA